MKTANKAMAICAIIMLTILGLSTHDADAIQFCTDEGGGVSSCREVSGWKTVVTGVIDEGGGNNPSGVCDAGLDFPRFRPGTKLVTFAFFTCEGELITTSFGHYCVGSTPPSVGQVVFSNCTKILEKVSGDGQTGTINSTLPQPLVVKVADSTGIQINWTITGPPGATGQSVSPATGTQVTVKLGNKPGPYTITATCTGCTGGSPQTFTATAKATDNILSVVSGDGQEGVMETILSEPLVVKVTDSAGNPKEGVAINWEITKVPEGAKGAILGSPESATNQDGLAGAFLTLGDTEGDYQVTATCPDCASGSSQVVFTAKAKCAIASDAIIPRDQCGSGVGNQDYDSLKDTKICGKGCALTALTMLLNFYGVETDVLKLNDWLKENKGYTVDGGVDWRKIKSYPGSPFTSITRLDSLSEALLKEELRQGHPVIAKVPGTGDSHFVLVFCKNGSTYKAWDPGSGTVKTYSKDQILGLRVFK